VQQRPPLVVLKILNWTFSSFAFALQRLHLKTRTRYCGCCSYSRLKASISPSLTACPSSRCAAASIVAEGNQPWNFGLILFMLVDRFPKPYMWNMGSLWRILEDLQL